MTLQEVPGSRLSCYLWVGTIPIKCCYLEIYQAKGRESCWGLLGQPGVWGLRSTGVAWGLGSAGAARLNQA